MKRFASLMILVSAMLASTILFAETLNVSAAASLTNAFKEIGTAFEKKHPNNKVAFNFAASGVLLQQIIQGAPVDIFAAADQESMDRAEKELAIKKMTRINFIGNELVLIVPINNQDKLSSLNDLTNETIKYIAIGNPSTTPNGRYARSAMQKANIWTTVEPKLVLAENVRQSLSYVSRGEVNAGFVFSTDAKQEEKGVTMVLTIPTVQENEQSGTWESSPIAYPIAETSQNKNSLATSFITFVLSEKGQQILMKYGFKPLK